MAGGVRTRASRQPVVAAGAGAPKYEQLKRSLIQRIESGEFAPGIALPPEWKLAEEADVARSTVRQAMASLETDGLVRRVHGSGTYVHDDALRILKAADGLKLFALIVPETGVGFYPGLQRSFEQSASALNGQIIVCDSGNDVDRQGNSILQLIDRQVAGVAIVPATNPVTPAFHIRQLQKQGIPVVCCARQVLDVQAPLLAISFEEVGRKAGDLIREAGHRHVALISGQRTPASEGYERGFRSAFKSAPAGGSLQVFYGASPNPDVAAHEAEVMQTLEQLFSQKRPPTAIFASFDSIAELIYVLLSQRGLKVPADVSLVGVGGRHRAGPFARRLTSITIDEDQLGRAAIELLEQMRSSEVAIDERLIRPVNIGWHAGETLAPCTDSGNGSDRQVAKPRTVRTAPGRKTPR